METLRIQRLLRQGLSLTKLNEQFGVIAKESKVNPGLYLFKYDQIRADTSNTVVQECRGLILDKNSSWQIVCFPYTKFFNYNEANAPKLDIVSTKAYPKLDGSLINLYYFNNEWRIATSGNPDAEGLVLNEEGKNITFKELFWETWNNLRLTLPTEIFKDYTFMFELTTPYNKIVVQHKNSNIVLHGIKHNITFEEVPLNFIGLQRNWEWCNWEICIGICIFNLPYIIERTERLNPLEQEGFVLVDKNFNRVKVKSTAYVNLHHIRSTMSFRSMLDIIRKNESEEFLSYFPEYKVLHNNIKTKYTKLFIFIQSFVNDWKFKKQELELQNLTLERKEVGLYFKDYFFCGIIFRLLYDNEKLEDLLKEMSIRKLEFWLEEIK